VALVGLHHERLASPILCQSEDIEQIGRNHKRSGKLRQRQLLRRLSFAWRPDIHPYKALPVYVRVPSQATEFYAESQQLLHLNPPVKLKVTTETGVPAQSKRRMPELICAFVVVLGALVGSSYS